MGWTYTHDISGSQVVAEVLRNYSWESEVAKVEVVESSVQIVRGVAYLAVRTTQKATGESEVWAGVALIRFNPRAADGYTFGIKTMDETMGLCEAECPERILRVLTPLKDGEREYAHQWRKACWDRLAKQKADRVKLRDGARVTLAHPLHFRDGAQRAAFTAKAFPKGKGKVLRFLADDGVYCRLTKAQLASATVGEAGA